MIGVIGLGGAGGNIADETCKRGFLSAAINFSQKDLDAVDVKYKLRLSGSEGVGKNRDEGIRLIQEQWEVATNFINDHFSNVDVLIFAFSSSGGSGSSIAPILLQLIRHQNPEKVICAFVVLPDYSEAVVSQINAIKTFDDLSDSDIAVFPIDNQQTKEIYKVVGKSKIYEISNNKAVDLLEKITKYTEMHSKNGNFDKTDLKTVFSTPGIAIISEIELMTIKQNITLSNEWICGRVNDSWIKSVFAIPDFSKVGRAALIFDGQEELLELIDPELMFSKFSNGMPLDLFEGYYHEHQGRFISILTGLPWCNNRLQDIERLIDSNKVEVALSNINQHKSNAVGLMDKIRKPKESKVPVSEIFKKFNR